MSDPEGYWTKHFQSAYLDDAANPAYPTPIRVAFLAYGTHKANGHARFKQREVANVLGSFDSIGTFIPADKYAVRRAIKTAMDWGLLAEGSKALCLIVPGHRIRGHRGESDAYCDRHPHPKVAGKRNLPTPKGAPGRALSTPMVAGIRTLSGSDPSLLLEPETPAAPTPHAQADATPSVTALTPRFKESA